MPRSPVSTARAGSVFSPAMVFLLLCTFGGFAGFYLLLSVVPLAVASGSAGAAGAGLVTGALMVATVAVQPPLPRLLARFGYRTALLAGTVALGAPSALLVLSTDLGPVVGVSLLRGAGFGIFVVASSAAAAELVPDHLRGRGTGWYGVANGVGAVLGLPFGVLLGDVLGRGWVFVLAAALPLAGALAAIGVRAPRPAPVRRARVLSGLADPPTLRPFVLQAASTVASGVIVTFLPLVVPHALAWVVPVALALQQLGVTVARGAAGALGDRYGHERLLAPAVLATGLGVLSGVWADRPWAVLAGSVLFGLGLGAVQNATLTLMLQRAGRAGYGTASTQWNLAFDAGTGLGGAGVGLVVEHLGHDAGFVTAAVLLFGLLVVARRDAAASTGDTGPLCEPTVHAGGTGELSTVGDPPRRP
ncbi:MFS transporter [Streptoalloteichus hindustanus]|uniref:Predicted arabinose efflux permease, MFS family n=1 Tax=Streptoalloteichus hindustanus TaxID=2017 RepID=A0A1M5DE99_STRHI|nr:MFS transporter [Streptoalloteichus hindustanus]SHF65408.1 Predicted arabinose efflux permease, MFS family [Streptoalloteichus hindustanus]